MLETSYFELLVPSTFTPGHTCSDLSSPVKNKFNTALASLKSIMKTLSTTLFAAILGLRPATAQQINTPSPIQPGFVTNCAGFTPAAAGDTCWGLAQGNGIGLNAFLSMNPQVHGIQGCGQSIWSGYHYCVNTETPTATTFYEANTPPPPPATTLPPPPPPPQTTPPPPPPPPATCDSDTDCYRAFRDAVPRVQPSQSSWCAGVLATPVAAADMAAFTGAPGLVAAKCTGDAHLWVTSLCGCWMAGTIPTLTV